MADDQPLLEVENLTTKFSTDNGTLTAVDGIDFDVDTGETVCIVGESGSGKTVATESITRIINTPPGEIKGTVRYNGRDLLSLPKSELRQIRGNEIAHIFQNPQEAMNHCYTVGWQITEALQIHQDVSDDEARAKAVDLMDRVGIANASSRFDDYPHEFSGGQKQRVMIAMALVGDPDLLIADEPTTALDVTVQAQILKLLNDLQEEFEMGILFVTHDLGVVAEIADRIVVMYAGKVMERGGVLDIFDHPAHPYTQQLLECLPEFGGSGGGIPGTLPDPHNPPDGCRFAPRCEYAEEACRTGDQPEEVEVAPGQQVSCVHYGPGGNPSIVRSEGLGPGDETGAVDGDSEVGPADD